MADVGNVKIATLQLLEIRYLLGSDNTMKCSAQLLNCYSAWGTPICDLTFVKRVKCAEEWEFNMAITVRVRGKVTDENKEFWEELIAYFPWYDTGHIENDSSNNSVIVACVFVTAVTFLPSRYLATIGGFSLSRCLAVIGEFLPSSCLATIRRYTYRHTDWCEGFFY
jgi:hypothetical protein